MLRIVVMVGTRKGCFLLESDEDAARLGGPRPVLRGLADLPRRPRRRDRGRSTPPPPASGTAPAIWRSADLGETWEHSSEGLAYGEGGELKLSKVSGPGGGARPAAGRRRGGRHLREPRRRRAPGRCSATLDGQPGRDDWNDAGEPAAGPSRHAGDPATHPDDPARFCVVVQGFGIFETTDDGATWTPRNEGLRADWPRRAPRGRLLRPQARDVAADRERLYQQNHCGMHRSDDGGRSWTEITEGLPVRLRLRRRRAPARPRQLLRDPARPRPRAAACPRPGRRLAHERRRLDAGGGSTAGLPQRDAYLGVLREGMAIDALDAPGLYFGTSTGQVFASADEGETWNEIASYLPGDRVGRGRGPRAAMADVHLPATLPPLFAGLPRRLEIDAGTVGEAIDEPGRALARPARPAVRAGPDAAAPHQRLRRPRAGRSRRRRSAAGSRVDVIAAISGG